MSKNQALFIYIFLVLIWSVNWTVIKLILETAPVIWTSALRYIISASSLVIMLGLAKKISLPKKEDLSAIFVIGFLQMTLMGLLMNVGVSYTSVGRSSILAYSTPLFVTPIAYFYLKEKIHRLQFCGLVLGALGIMILFNPFAERTNPHEMLGSSVLILCAILWAIVIVFIRQHKWRSSPLELSVWQNLLAAILSSIAAFYFEGPLEISFTPTLIGQFIYLGFFATAFAFWASTAISQYLPAVVNSLGLLAVPVASMIFSTFYLGEKLDIALIIATTLIIGGIVLGFMSNLKKPSFLK